MNTERWTYKRNRRDVPSGPQIVETDADIYMAIPNPKQSVVGQCLWLTHSWEPAVTAELLKLPQVGSFIDVGAHIGYFAALYAKVHFQTPVFAFEPDRQAFTYMQHTLAINELVNVMPLLMGVDVFTNFVTIDGKGGLTCANGKELARARSEGKLATADLNRYQLTVSLDALLFKGFFELPVGAMKIDVEGQELSVLKSAVQLLKRYQPNLLVEVHPELLELQGLTPVMVIEFLANLGYTYRREIIGSRCPDTNNHTILFTS